MNKDALYDVAAALLSSASDALAAGGTTVPSRAYVADGEVAFDSCGQLAVSIERVFGGLPAQEAITPLQKNCALALSAEIAVWILRCVPTMSDAGDPPEADHIDDAAHSLDIDAWVILNGIIKDYRDGTLLPKCNEFAFFNAQAAGPEGGIGGWVLRFQAQL